MALEDADFADAELLHLFGEALVIFAQLHVRMRIGCGREWNAFGDRQLDDRVGRIELVYRFAPAGGGKLDREPARADELERLGGQRLRSSRSADARES